MDDPKIENNIEEDLPEMFLIILTVPNHRPGSLDKHKKRTHERVLSHSSCPFCDNTFYFRRDMLTHHISHI